MATASATSMLGNPSAFHAAPRGAQLRREATSERGTDRRNLAWIDGGFFVRSPKVLEYLESNRGSGSTIQSSDSRPKVNSPLSFTALLASDGYVSRLDPARRSMTIRQGVRKVVGMNQSRSSASFNRPQPSSGAPRP